MLGIPYTTYYIPESRGGTAATILAMSRLAVAGARDPRIVMLARNITAAAPSHDHRAEADAIFRWVKRYVKYRLDSQELEVVNAPWVTVMLPGGDDCDGHSTLVAALGLSVGLDAYFRTVAADPAMPGEWSHVYPVLGLHGQPLWPADTTQPPSYLGWEPDHTWLKTTWDVRRLANGALA